MQLSNYAGHFLIQESKKASLKVRKFEDQSLKKISEQILCMSLDPEGSALSKGKI